MIFSWLKLDQNYNFSGDWNVTKTKLNSIQKPLAETKSNLLIKTWRSSPAQPPRTPARGSQGPGSPCVEGLQVTGGGGGGCLLVLTHLWYPLTETFLETWVMAVNELSCLCKRCSWKRQTKELRGEAAWQPTVSVSHPPSSMTFHLVM